MQASFTVGNHAPSDTASIEHWQLRAQRTPFHWTLSLRSSCIFHAGLHGARLYHEVGNRIQVRVVEDQGGRPETARPSASLQVCQVLQPRHSFMPLSRASVSRKEMAARPQLRHLSQSLDGSRCLKLSTVCESSASPRLHQSLSSRLSKPTSIKESSEAQKTTTLAFEHTASARAHLTSSPPRRSSSAELLGLLAPAV